jgi:hypothetical protein
MNSVFKRIYHLTHPGVGSKNVWEDYLTELVSEVFKNDETLISFIREFLNVKLKRIFDLEVTTQETYRKLDLHFEDSRPDLVIRFRDENKKYLIFLENKVECGEGTEQLNRYSDHLSQFKSEDYRTYLIYLTKYYDPKEGVDQLYQLRWYQVYNWLLNHRNEYNDRILELMEDMKMNQSRCFSPLDIYSIQQMNNIRSMMDDCLDGDVDRKMQEYFGKPAEWSNRNTQLRDHKRYYKVDSQGNWNTWVGCGFNLSKDDYPSVSVIYEVNPKYKQRKAVIKAMKEFLNDHPDWKGISLDDNSKWSHIVCSKSMAEFATQEDQIGEIQRFFIAGLEEINKLRIKYPDLGWSISTLA